MAERTGSATFSDDELLWLALAARNSGERPSSLIKIRGEVTALDFDLACTVRLLRFDNERESNRFRMLAAMFGADEDPCVIEDEGCVEW